MSKTACIQNPVPMAALDSQAHSYSGLGLQCPTCGDPMGGIEPRKSAAHFRCPSCGFLLANGDGIWKALPHERATRFQRFTQEYETIRSHEGRGSGGGHYYLSLPYKDTTGRNSWQWKIRGRSFRFLVRKILAKLERRRPGGLDILDIGAGNCWMSYRLALRGHRPVALDLLANDHDGLRAARHYLHFLPRPFLRFQAEMDRLPFTSAQFDVVIFNASFHYSEDYQRTLRESLRCLRRPGYVLIVDSPFYPRDESGRRMMEERHAEFQRKYGFRSDSISSCEYITQSVLDDLARDNQVIWKTLKPWYGLGWALRPAWRWLCGRREPAKFHIFWGIVGAR